MAQTGEGGFWHKWCEEPGGDPGGGTHQERPNGAGGLMGPAEWEGTAGVGDPKRNF